jgi:hypothetical protein
MTQNLLESKTLFRRGGGMGILWLNSCPRCKGDILLDNKDQYGWYEQCLQCGYLRDLQTLVQVEQGPVQEKKKGKKLARAARAGSVTRRKSVQGTHDEAQ